jgi:queuosine precursor transporter
MSSIHLPQVGIIIYPFVYIFDDIYTEVYGYRVTRKIVWTGFGCLLLTSVIAYMYTLLPATESFTGNEAFNLIFRASPFVAVGALVANFSGELVNSYILAKLKVYTQGRHEWVRLIASTFFGQLVDNSIFFTTIFLAAGWYTLPELFPLVSGSVAFCTIVEVLFLPITRQVIAFLKHKEGLDTYDRGTNFSPFSLS